MSSLYVVGIGPGHPEGMTFAAREAIEKADMLVGYRTYIDLVAPLYPEKPVFSTAMRSEVERCKKAIDLAAEGKNVAVVCSGDAGVFGMAGLILELAENHPAADEINIEVIPGVTAALAGAALLGAPLSHDFAIISLSDLLTPWDIIEKRIAAAAMGDFCMAFYNPASKKRTGHLRKACDIMEANGKRPDTICGYVQNAGREGEMKKVLTLAELKEEILDMVTIVFIGNSLTRRIDGRMVTPRGYPIG